MSTATAAPPAGRLDPPPAAPRFQIGMPVKIGYLGLYYRNGRATDRDGRTVELGAVVTGLRLVAVQTSEDQTGGMFEDGTDPEPPVIAVGYPGGWEYQIGYFRTTRGGPEWHERAWLKESELVAMGYAEPPDADDPDTGEYPLSPK